jgi:hypothetical protein
MREPESIETKRAFFFFLPSAATGAPPKPASAMAAFIMSTFLLGGTPLS